MQKDLYRININYTDESINNILKNLPEEQCNFTNHFNHNEEFFIKLDSSFHVPQFKIHHDVNITRPEEEYLQKIRNIVELLSSKLPRLFKNTMYFFDPAKILKLFFFNIFKYKNTEYLFLLTIDLAYRPQAYTLINKGTNDITSSYDSSILFLDPVFIPIKEIVKSNNKLCSFIIKSLLSETWIGEKGDFYHKTGYWMDDALTKFFSKLIFRPYKKYYPYYPLICRYNTICKYVYNFSKKAEALPVLHNSYKYILPFLSEIQHIIRKKIENNVKDYIKVEELDIFKEIKKNIPEELISFSDNVEISIYLNENNMKEYKIDF